MLCTMMNCSSSAYNTYTVIVPKNTATEGLQYFPYGHVALEDFLSKVIIHTVKITTNNTKPLDSFFNLAISLVTGKCTVYSRNIIW
jgi:hypothetical protein